MPNLGLRKPLSGTIKSIHPLRVIVGCGLRSGIIIGSYFFESENGLDITFFVLAFHGIDVNDIWFQQNGANYHTSYATIDLLRQTFDDRLISRNGDAN